MESENLIVADRSPLIALARVGHLQLLPKLATRIVVPRTVWEEVTEARSDAPGAADVLSQPWIEVLSAETTIIEKFSRYVDKGEAEALALAESNLGSLLLIDERKGRRIAELFGLRRVGTLGLLAKAKEAGLIERVRPVVDRLIAANIYIREEIILAVLREVGED